MSLKKKGVGKFKMIKYKEYLEHNTMYSLVTMVIFVIFLFLDLQSASALSLVSIDVIRTSISSQYWI
jgi:hypothetical protein